MSRVVVSVAGLGLTESLVHSANLMLKMLASLGVTPAVGESEPVVVYQHGVVEITLRPVTRVVQFSYQGESMELTLPWSGMMPPEHADKIRDFIARAEQRTAAKEASPPC